MLQHQAADYVISVYLSGMFIAQASDEWLQKYVYRIELTPWTFLFTCIGALTIALLTVSFHAIQSALSNPVNILRSE
jgi:putative ABC transport system permease protein